MDERKAERAGRTRRRRRLEQRLLGLALVALSLAALWIGATGTGARDRDGTAALLTGAAGLWMLTTRRLVIF